MNGVYKIGDRVLNNWILVRQLGKGNYGTVFEAEREDFGVTYKAAIKIISIPQNKSEIESLKSEGMSDEMVSEYFVKFVQEIVQEVSIMARLKGNNNVVNYEDHEIVPYDSGIGWDIIIRMELLTPLNTRISDATLKRKDIIKLGVDICNALMLCEGNDIIHRDVKPENIFISATGNYKLGDFGFARTIDKTNGGMSRKGTYGYMAPEVYQDKPYGATVDIYSLGLVLYSLINKNRLPFLPDYPNEIRYSDRLKSITRRMNGESLPSPCASDNALSPVILKACAYDPADRFQSALAMKKALVDAINGKETKPKEIANTFSMPAEKKMAVNPQPDEKITAIPRPDTKRTENPDNIKNDKKGKHDKLPSTSIVPPPEIEDVYYEDKTISVFNDKGNKVRRKNKKRKKTIALSITATGVIAAFVAVLVLVNAPKSRKYNDAMSFYSIGDYEQAKAIFSGIPGYKDSNILIAKCDEGLTTSKYQRAQMLFKNGKLTEAKAIFEELDDYEDSMDMLIKIESETIYLNGLNFYNAGDYLSAQKYFEQAGDYRDSIAYIEKCKTGAQEQDYEKAIRLFEEGKYTDAANLFKLAPELNSSSEYIEICDKLIKICDSEEGQIVSFGRYEQDNNPENGKDPIEWRILKKENDAILLVSKYCIECAVYNDRENTNWANSSIRKWLNNDFFNDGFSNLEKGVILSTENDNQKISTHSTDNGANTVDEVFLLTIEDANRYFTSDPDRAAEPTARALSRGIKAVNNRSSWWLRSMGNSSSAAAYVFLNGHIGEDGDIVNSNNMGVRPVIRIRVSSQSDISQQ